MPTTLGHAESSGGWPSELSPLDTYKRAASSWAPITNLNNDAPYNLKANSRPQTFLSQLTYSNRITKTLCRLSAARPISNINILQIHCYKSHDHRHSCTLPPRYNYRPDHTHTTMSMADTYILASKARAKLTRAAQQPDHDLRVLVSHANMLDNLMDKIQTHRESILNGSYSQQKVSFALPEITHVNVEDDYDSDSSDDEDDESDESFYYKATQVDYDSDEDGDYESLSDLSDDEQEEDEEESQHVEAHHTYQRAHNFRHMPTIDEMTELELDELSSESESESENDIEEHEETDITDLKRTPSLVYSTTEDDDTDDDEEEEELQRTHHTHTHSEYTPSAKEQDSLQSRPSTHGDLLLENLESNSYSQPLVC